MFTGIVEALGTVVGITSDRGNKTFTIESPFTQELKVDQSVSHNGVCLTVTSLQGNHYTVTAIDETLQRTNLGSLKEGDKVNLERSMIMNGRIDGHIVQGHVDCTADCISVEDRMGSWLFTFSYTASGEGYFTVEKGSVCVNGVSLTVVNSEKGRFSVAIIPFTMEHTNFSMLKEGSKVNIEFDIFGKYAAKYLSLRQ